MIYTANVWDAVMLALHRLPSIAATAIAFAISLAMPAAAETTIRIAMHSDLKIVDPVATTAYITRNHGYLVWDTLFAIDANYEMKPQMVDTWSTTPDGLVWTFNLREGLEWHDGNPVTPDDCIASIKRFAKRDVLGLKFAEFVKEYVADGARTFKIVLKEPFGLVLDTLGKASLSPLFMMPKRLADKDPAAQITPDEVVGSGPFIFKSDEWKPGSRVVYVKNPKYKPRAEPPSGLAGGKVVHVDRVEWHYIPDAQTQINALLQNEIDIVETVPIDLMPLLEKDPNINAGKLADLQYFLRLNWLQPPFKDNPKIRQAAEMALEQNEMLQGAVGDARFYRTCKSFFPCGTPFADEAPMKGYVDGNAAKARELLKEGGYDGTPVVIISASDVSTLAPLGPITKAQLERAGFKVDLQVQDWSTVLARIRKRDPPAQGGWNIVISALQLTDVLNPLTHSTFNMNCQTSTNGWPCDETMERLRDEFARSSKAEERKQLASKILARQAEVVGAVPLGEFSWVGAARKSVERLSAPVTVFWGMKKN